MVQMAQSSVRDGGNISVQEASKEFASTVIRLAHAGVLPAAEAVVENEPSLVTLTFVTDCARRAEAAILIADYHAIRYPDAPRFEIASAQVRLSDTAHPAHGPAWRDAR